MGEPPAVNSCNLETLKIQALSEVCKLIGEVVDLDTTLTRMLQVLGDVLQMERASLVLFDSQRKRLRIRASYGLSSEEESRGVYGLSEGICGQIFQSGTPCVVPDINREPLFLNRTGSRREIDKKGLSFIGVPLFVNTRTVGVLTVDSLFGPEVSFEEDVGFLNILGTLISQFLVLHQAIAQKEERLLKENKSLKAELHSRFNRHCMVGQSRPILEVFKTVEKVAPSQATVLLLGESGTGKELVARAVHESSPRKQEPFIKINCAALPENLLESELLGHEKGAFTGADAAKPGHFERAHKGTIFLDEIGELPLKLQAKLLRVLQESQFERLGGSRTITVDVRVIAATNVDLQDSVDRGLFRDDLFYRLNVVPVKLPPLRERREDIVLLINHFLRSSNERNDKEVSLDFTALDLLTEYDWPGNVRELQNLIERLVILTDEMMVSSADLKAYLIEKNHPGKSAKIKSRIADSNIATPARLKSGSLREMERQEIEAALQRNGWVQARAARELGLTQRQIGYRIKQFALKRPAFALEEK